MNKRVYRSKSQKIIAGVCGGLAEYFHTDPVFVRLAVVLLTLMHGIGIVLYIAAIFIIPEEPFNFQTPPTIEEADEIKQNNKIEKKRVFGIILVLIGGFFFLQNFFPALELSHIVPLALMFAGGMLIYYSKKTKSVEELQ
ncbi:MAG: PspC domain-containing protein [Ignavibacteriaceae bacterium]|nr:PspC domain-containing protein [Ignavibacteriaceae bacterium]